MVPDEDGGEGALEQWQRAATSPSRSSLAAVAGPHTPGMFSRTVAHHYLHLAKAHPHRDALVVAATGTRLTFEQLHRSAQATARSLQGHGFISGDVLALWLSNCEEWIVAMLGAAHADVVVSSPVLAYEHFTSVLKLICMVGNLPFTV